MNGHKKKYEGMKKNEIERRERERDDKEDKERGK